MIRLISSDMDGTLLDSYRQITEVNIHAIRKLQENGIEFIINTGREHPNVVGILKEAGLQCDMICSNGSCGFDKAGHLLFEHTIPKKTVQKIFDTFRRFGMVPSIFTKDGRISLLQRDEREKYTREILVPAIQVNHPDFEYTEAEFRSLIDDVIFVDGEDTLLSSDHNILKITSNSTETETLKVLRAELEKIPGLAVVSTVSTDIEITSEDAQKGIALLQYADRFGYQPEEIVAIGDSENDYSMLSIPGIHSVAMENASDEIRNICVYQTRANTRDGIAYIISCILADRENFEL